MLLPHGSLAALGMTQSAMTEFDAGRLAERAPLRWHVKSSQRPLHEADAWHEACIEKVGRGIVTVGPVDFPARQHSMRRLTAHFLTKDVPMNLVPAAGFPLSNAGHTKAGASFAAQSFRIDAVFEIHRKNADAVARAACVVLDGLNQMAKRQGELLAAAVKQHVKVALDVFTQASLEDRASKQVCTLRDVYNSSVASLREQSDIAAQANVAAGDILGTRVSEAIEEVGMLFGRPGAPTPVSGETHPTVAEPAAAVDATLVAEPAAAVEEAAGADNAGLDDVGPIVGPATKTRPKKASPPGRPARRKSPS